MPLRNERLEGYQFMVSPVRSAGGGEDEIVLELVLVDNPEDPSHMVAIPFTEKGRLSLIRQASGGLMIASEMPSSG